jgi:phage terminase Nu1 subunit (DNA packaging protein)
MADNLMNLEKLSREVLGISSRWYRQLVKEQGAPEIVNGQVDAFKACKFLIDYYRNLSEGRGGLGLTEERTRLISYEAEIKKMELKKMQGSLIEAELVRQALTDVFYMVKSKVDAIPVRIASEVAYLLKDPKDINIVKTKAQNITKDIEKELSDVKTYRDIISYQKGNKDISTETEFDDESMGG